MKKLVEIGTQNGCDQEEYTKDDGDDKKILFRAALGVERIERIAATQAGAETRFTALHQNGGDQKHRQTNLNIRHVSQDKTHWEYCSRERDWVQGFKKKADPRPTKAAGPCWREGLPFF